MNTRAVEFEKQQTETLSGQSIIYFGPGKWEGMWRNRHQMMSRFARTNKVMYVEPAYSLYRYRKEMRRGQQGWIDLVRAFGKVKVSRLADHFYLYHSPVYVPIFGHFPLEKISWWLWNKLLKRTLRRLGFSRPIIWLSQPYHSYYLGNFAERLIIYHVVDEYLAYPGVTPENRTVLEESEKQLLGKADLVLVVSEKLLKTKGVYNKHTCLIPNAVDYESYEKARLDTGPLPADIAQLPSPVIGYSGLISRRLDLGLIERIAATHPDWSLVLVGMVNDKGCEQMMSRLRHMSNVYFSGIKEIGQVPYYIKAFDVGIIPYMINRETENLSALKLYDFMAVGMPVVATAFPAAGEFKDVVYIAADSHADFIQRIEDALAENNEILAAERRRIASQNTWEQRMKQVSDCIQVRLKEKIG
jgi:glycosyltransferase involved in cell wall biosynthesis